MKDSTVVLLMLGGFALIFWAFSRGMFSATGLGINPATGQPYGTITAPQPTANYSGYLAATSAPAVSGAVNNAISGLGTGLNHLFAGWFGGSGAVTPAPNQTASANSPSLSAQPAGAEPYGPFQSAANLQGTANPIGPVMSDTAYSNTNGSAFDYTGLANANAYDPSYSLTDPAFLSA